MRGAFVSWFSQRVARRTGRATCNRLTPSPCGIQKVGHDRRLELEGFGIAISGQEIPRRGRRSREGNGGRRHDEPGNAWRLFREGFAPSLPGADPGPRPRDAATARGFHPGIQFKMKREGEKVRVSAGVSRLRVAFVSGFSRRVARRTGRATCNRLTPSPCAASWLGRR